MRLSVYMLMLAVCLVAWEVSANGSSPKRVQMAKIAEDSGPKTITDGDQEKHSLPEPKEDKITPPIEVKVEPSVEASSKEGTTTTTTEEDKQTSQKDISQSATQNEDLKGDENPQGKSQPTLGAPTEGGQLSVTSQRTATSNSDGLPIKEAEHNEDLAQIQPGASPQSTKVSKPADPVEKLPSLTDKGTNTENHSGSALPPTIINASNASTEKETSASPKVTQSGGQHSKVTDTKTHHTTTTSTDNTDDKNKSSEKPGAFTTNVKAGDAQNSNNIPIEYKPVTQGITTTQITSGRQPTPALSTITKGQPDKKYTHSSNTGLTTKNNNPDPQKTSSSTNTGSKENSKDINSQTDQIATSSARQATQKNTKASSSGGEQSQLPAQTPTSNKDKGNDTSTTIKTTGTSKSEKNLPLPQKTETTTTPVADGTTGSEAATTGDKGMTTAQTSETFRAAEAKKNYTKELTSLTKLSKDSQLVDNKDSSIGNSLLFAFAALTSFIVVAVAPAS